MGKKLQINLDEAHLISLWFSCAFDAGEACMEDCDLATKIEEFITQKEKEKEDG